MSCPRYVIARSDNTFGYTKVYGVGDTRAVSHIENATSYDTWDEAAAACRRRPYLAYHVEEACQTFFSWRGAPCPRPCTY